MERLYQSYKDRVQFYLVYIREAHPDSVLYIVNEGKKALQKITQTKTEAERTETAQLCVATLNLTMPTLVDGDDNAVSRSYAGWPDRLYVIGVDGRIAYQGGPGPAGFRPDEVERWLRKNVP